MLIKKKCRGGPVNGGTYYTLGPEVPGMPVVRNKWQASVGGKERISAVDTGIGCAPIRAAAPVGIRGDNTRFRFNAFTATRL